MDTKAKRLRWLVNTVDKKFPTDDDILDIVGSGVSSKAMLKAFNPLNDGFDVYIYDDESGLRISDTSNGYEVCKKAYIEQVQTFLERQEVA